MKNFHLVLLPILLTLISLANASDSIPSYTKAEILLIQSDINTQQLAQDLNVLRPDLEVATIRYPGDLLRDSVFSDYISWYQQNFHPNTPKKLLESREPHVNQVLSELWGSYLLVEHKYQDQQYYSLFIEGNRSPLFTRVKPKSKPLSTWISENLFSQKPKRKLSQEERAHELALPAAEYYEAVKLDRFVALGMGQHFSMTGSSPLEFNEFYRLPAADTANIYKWAKISSPIYQISGGWLFAEVLGTGFLAKYSTLQMNYNPKTNPGVQVWHYNRYELGMFATLGNTYYLNPKFSLYPHVYLSFQYMIFDEEFQIKTPTQASELRVNMHTINAASGALGLKMMYNRSFGIDLQWGLNNASGKSPDDYSKTDTGVGVSGRDVATTLQEQFFVIQFVYNSPSSF